MISTWLDFWLKGGGQLDLTSGMRDFSKFISENAMLDLALEGDASTWSNNQRPHTTPPPPTKKPSMSRIDWFLVST